MIFHRSCLFTRGSERLTSTLATETATYKPSTGMRRLPHSFGPSRAEWLWIPSGTHGNWQSPTWENQFFLGKSVIWFIAVLIFLGRSCFSLYSKCSCDKLCMVCLSNHLSFWWDVHVGFCRIIHIFRTVWIDVQMTLPVFLKAWKRESPHVALAKFDQIWVDWGHCKLGTMGNGCHATIFWRP